MTEEGAMDLHEYARDVALDALSDHPHWPGKDAALTEYERDIAHAVADAVADLGVT